MKILVLEDKQTDWETLNSALKQYLVVHPDKELNLIWSTTRADFDQKLKEHQDIGGVVCDIIISRTDGEEENGEKALDCFINDLQNKSHLMPLAILTNVETERVPTPLVQVFIKGKKAYIELFDHMWNTHVTGISEITGLNGLFINEFKSVCKDSIAPYFSSWQNKAANFPSDRIKKALQRHVLAHLVHKLSDNRERFFPEEFFIYSPFNNLQTGRILENSKENIYYVLITPNCTLSNNQKCNLQLLPLKDLSSQEWNKKNKDNIKNNKKQEYHYIPLTPLFPESVIDFSCLLISDDHNQYSITPYQIAPEFIKNIQSRFSTFYNRQGQPELDL